MRNIFWLLSFTSLTVWAQSPQPVNDKFSAYYFDPYKKTERILYIQDNVYNRPRNPGQSPGCAELKNPQPPFTDVAKRSEEIVELINKRFSQSFAENPEIKAAFEKDMKAIAEDPTCLQPDNICRGKLLATAKFHYENLRPDIPGCKGYVKQDPMDNKNYNRDCEIELKYRKERLDTYSRGGLDARATYTDQLVAVLNNVTSEVLKKSLHKSLGFTKGTRKNPSVEVFDMQVPEICSRSPFAFPLVENLYKDPIVNAQPVKPAPEKKVEPCVEEIKTLYSEFVPLNFTEGKSTVGADQVDPVKKKINDFIKANPKMVITGVSVTSSSSKTPFHKTIGGKKVVDPNSDQRNLDLAQQRADFAARALEDLKKNNSELANVKFETKSSLAGPDYKEIDKNDRWAIPDKTEDYKQRVESFYNEYKEMLNKDALIKSPDELLDKNRFHSLYEVRFKPFQGFRIEVSGYSTETMKCGESSSSKSNKSGSSSKGANQ